MNAKNSKSKTPAPISARATVLGQRFLSSTATTSHDLVHDNTHEQEEQPS